MRPQRAFTLIEIMAVLVIFALLAAFVMPNLSLVSRRAVRRDAEQLGAWIELARQRAVVTSVPHRLSLDLENGAYRLEWLGSDPAPEPAEPGLEALDLRPGALLSLEPPRGESRSYRPLHGSPGRRRWLENEVSFTGVKTSAGWVERGEVFVSFERDGSASYALILIANEDGDELEIEVLPLAAAARIRHVES